MNFVVFVILKKKYFVFIYIRLEDRNYYFFPFKLTAHAKLIELHFLTINFGLCQVERFS